MWRIPIPVEALPWGSRSITSTACPASARAAPRLTAVVDFPTPPFWFAMATTRALFGSTGPTEVRSGFRPALTRAGRPSPFDERGDEERAWGEGLLTAGS